MLKNSSKVWFVDLKTYQDWYFSEYLPVMSTFVYEGSDGLVGAFSLSSGVGVDI